MRKCLQVRGRAEIRCSVRALWALALLRFSDDAEEGRSYAMSTPKLER